MSLSSDIQTFTNRIAQKQVEIVDQIVDELYKTGEWNWKKIYLWYRSYTASVFLNSDSHNFTEDEQYELLEKYNHELGLNNIPVTDITGYIAIIKETVTVPEAEFPEGDVGDLYVVGVSGPTTQKPEDSDDLSKDDIFDDEVVDPDFGWTSDKIASELEGKADNEDVSDNNYSDAEKQKVQDNTDWIADYSDPDLTPYQKKDEKGVKNGYVGLTSNTVIDPKFLPDEAKQDSAWQGTLELADGTNVDDLLPAISNSTNQYSYLIVTADTNDVSNCTLNGVSGLTFGHTDYIYINYNENKYTHVKRAGGGVDSVNGETGAVTLTQDDVGDGTTYKQLSSTNKAKIGTLDGKSVTGTAHDSTGFYKYTKGSDTISTVKPENVELTKFTALSDLQNYIDTNANVEKGQQFWVIDENAYYHLEDDGSGGIQYQASDTSQTLSMDDSPTDGSGNAVTSDGVYHAVREQQNPPTSIDELEDVDLSGIADGHMLQYSSADGSFVVVSSIIQDLEGVLLEGHNANNNPIENISRLSIGSDFDGTPSGHNSVLINDPSFAFEIQQQNSNGQCLMLRYPNDSIGNALDIRDANNNISFSVNRFGPEFGDDTNPVIVQGWGDYDFNLGSNDDFEVYYSSGDPAFQIFNTGQLFLTGEIQFEVGSSPFDVAVQGGSKIFSVNGNNSSIWLESNSVYMPILPTGDPGEANRLWNDSGTLKISSG